VTDHGISFVLEKDCALLRALDGPICVEETEAETAVQITLLGAGARTRFSDLADHPQGCFDCWIEPQEENFQPGHSTACRDAFCSTPHKLRTAMAPKPVPKAETAPPPARVPNLFLLYFTFDNDKLTAAGETVVDAAVMSVRKIRTTDFAVTGHAGRAGSDEYNMELSLRRANAVREALVARGINPARISVAGQVEVEPTVATSEDVSEPTDRRGDMFVLK
jgi:OOP family OmpA-OmpF porin